MARLAVGLVLSTLALAACGGGSGGSPDAAPLANPGFAPPTITTTAYTKSGGGWTKVGPANWSCLGTPSADVAATVDITLTGPVVDYQTPTTPVGGAMISVYDGTAVDSTPLVSATADGGGSYSLVVPSGHKRIAFKTTSVDYFDTYLLNQYLVPDMAAQTKQLEPISNSSSELLLALIGITRTPGTGVLAGAIRDCDHHEVEGAIATVSATAGMPDHLSGAASFYLTAATVSVPTRNNQQPYTNTDGLFLVVQLPATPTAYIQVWGFLPAQDPAKDDLTLIAELPVPVVGDSIVTASLEAVRSE